MPSLYTENSEKWKNLASIDYFTQFVKAWIPFNAWYKNYYPDLKTDREAINEIKAHHNKFRNRLVSLLDNGDNDGVAFKSRIAELHLELERKHIFNKNERISFERIVIESNPKKQNNFSYQSVTYKVEREISGRAKKEVQIEIVDRNGGTRFCFTQVNGFDLDELTLNQDFKRLSQNQQNKLKTCYEEINPSKPISLLIQDWHLIKDIKEDQDSISRSKKCIEMGNLLFINDTDQLCKGIIEILYKLRNVLFHGEIIPDGDTNKVYEPAYQILYTLIQAL
jgi:hypothetical protein